MIYFTLLMVQNYASMAIFSLYAGIATITFFLKPWVRSHLTSSPVVSSWQFHFLGIIKFLRAVAEEVATDYTPTSYRAI